MYGCYKDVKERMVGDKEEEVWQRVWSIGGESSWYYGNFLWTFRGLLDKAAGGVGLNRGRTRANDIHPGDALDFSRVFIADREQKRLVLFAEMKLPGEAWLEFAIAADGKERRLIQLTDAEAAFRIHKQDLKLRPIWHQREDRVQAHIMVCFLAYVLWKCLGQMCKRAGLGDEPRTVLQEIKTLTLADVVLPTKSGTQLRLRCVMKLEKHLAIPLERLNLRPPLRLEMQHKM